MRRLVTLFALSACTLACPTAEPPALAPLHAEFSGCAGVLRGPICQLDPRSPSLRVWLDLPSDASPTFAGAVNVTKTRSVGGGVLYDLTVGPTVAELDVTAHPRSGPQRFVLRLSSIRKFPLIDEAERLRSKGDFEGAERALAKIGSSNPEELTLAKGLRARIALRRGDFEEAVRGLRDSAGEHARAGRLLAEANDTFALVYTLHQRMQRFGEADAALEPLMRSDVPEVRARAPMYRGQIAVARGDSATALRELRAAALGTERLGLAPASRRMARHLLAAVLACTGNTDEALELIAQVKRELHESREVNACERVEVALAAGFVDMRAKEHRYEPVITSPGDERALAESVACNDAYLSALAVLHLARIAARAGKTSEARRYLEEWHDTALEHRRVIDTLEALDVRGRVAMLEKRHEEALTIFEDGRDRARDARRVEHEWRFTLGKAEALEGLGRPALATYLDAERILDENALRIPIAEGRSEFLSDAAESAQRLVEKLLDAGRADRALAVVRAVRVRAIARLAAANREESAASRDRYLKERDERDLELQREWTLSGAERSAARDKRQVTSFQERGQILGDIERAQPSPASGDVAPRASPRPGDVLLAFFPRGPGSWFGFVAHAGRVRAFPIEDLDATALDRIAPEALAEKLLAPAMKELRGARRIALLTHGALDAVDFHALPLGGEPLVALAPVVYLLDLPALSRPTSGGALIVAPTTGDLPAALEEARVAEEALHALALTGAGATGPAVRDRLGHASFLHYAGHSKFLGSDGVESALSLAGGTRLTTTDVLALPRVPEAALLSACDAGRGTLGIARALLVAGTHRLVAPTRPIGDAAALAFTRAFYTAFAGDRDVASATRTAQLARRAHGDPSWSAMRVLVRSLEVARHDE